MTILDNSYWSSRYVNNDAGWDTGGITTPLKTYFDQLQDKSISILIPGCGNSYEAAYLLQKGFFNITLIDISEVLCDSLKEKFAVYLPKGLQIICGDFFELEATYDLIVEQTFFCALLPSLRKKYVLKMKQLLKTDGKLVGLLFNRSFEGGPPFGGNEDEYRQLFSPYFEIAVMSECYNSIAPRKGAELFVVLKNRGTL